MRKKNLEWYLILAAAVLLWLPGCITESMTGNDTVISKPGNEPEVSSVTFSIPEQDTRSSICPDENAITDLNIAVYCNGHLVAGEYLENALSTTLEVPSGRTYDIFATANTGRIDIPETEDEFKALSIFETNDINDIGDMVPMCWSRTGFSPTGLSCAVEMQMERLVSRILFSVNKTVLEGLAVTSVRLCQGATSLYPFRWTEGNKAVGEDGTADGDYASDEDIAILNNGGEIVFYAFENCQGNLLPDNDDPWKKVPDNLPDKSGLCTYLEVGCRFESGHLYEGDIVYRFYAGQDNCRNFDIKRNTEQHIRLTLSREGMKELSWMVDSSVSLRDGYAAGYLKEGGHGLNELYVGERFVYGLFLTDELVAHIGQDTERCRIVFQSTTTSGDISFGEWSRQDPELWLFALTATPVEPGFGNIVLLDEKGEFLSTLSQNVRIAVPFLTASRKTSVGDSDNDFGLDGQISTDINGSAVDFHIYLTDLNGYNLNKNGVAGFDLGLFGFSGNHGTDIPDNLRTNNVVIEKTPGRENSGGPAASFRIRCVNDGTSQTINDSFISMLTAFQGIKFRVEETTFGRWTDLSVLLNTPRAKLTLVDNSWAKYHDTQMSLLVENPSNLPMTIDFWQFMNPGKLNSVIDYDENEVWLEQNATLDGMYFLSSSFSPTASSNNMSSLQDPCTGSRAATIYAENTSRGTPGIKVGDATAYPLEGVKSEALLNTLRHYRRLNNAMYNIFQVVGFELSLEDQLSDGSSQLNSIYGYDGYNDQGMYSSDIGIYDAMTAGKLTELVKRHESGDYQITIRIDTSTGKIYGKTNKGSLNLYFNYSGSVNGYVQTHPNGTWGKAQDNYCSATISKTTGPYTITTSETEIGGGALTGAFQAIYNQTFFDSYNKIGSANNYQHCAHPTTGSMTIKARQASAASGYIPVKVTVSGKDISYYHPQDGYTYTVSISSSFTPLRFTHVKVK